MFSFITATEKKIAKLCQNELFFRTLAINQSIILEWLCSIKKNGRILVRTLSFFYFHPFLSSCIVAWSERPSTIRKYQPAHKREQKVTGHCLKPHSQNSHPPLFLNLSTESLKQPVERLVLFGKIQNSSVK